MAEERKAAHGDSQHQGTRDSSELGTHGGPGKESRDNKKKQTQPEVTPDSTIHSR